MGGQQRIVRQRIVIPYAPRAAFLPLHNRHQRWGIMVAHRRAGKTVACVNEANKAAITCPKPDGRYAYVAPFYVQAKDIAWTYAKRYALPIPGVEVNESELRIDYPNGARVRLYGADNADRLRGGYLDGVILDEYADMAPSVWGEVIRPMLADRQGWAVFLGTPKGRNGFFEKWQEATADPDRWFTLMLKASGSGLIGAAELEEARREMTPEQYAQEFECSFDAAILGAYYGRELADADRQGRIRGVEPDPSQPVHLVADLGIDDPSAWIAWQLAPDGIRVLRAYENSGHALAHYVSEITSWGWRIGDCWLPHDARARSLNDGKTRIEVLRKIAPSWSFRMVPDHKVIDGINALRLSLPRMHIDADGCKDMLEAWRQYKADYDDKLRVFRTRPRHDWTSHYADAGRYLAMAWRELRPVAPKPRPAADLVYSADPATGRIVGNMSVRDVVARKMREQRERRGY